MISPKLLVYPFFLPRFSYWSSGPTVPCDRRNSDFASRGIDERRGDVKGRSDGEERGDEMKSKLERGKMRQAEPFVLETRRSTAIFRG